MHSSVVESSMLSWLCYFLLLLLLARSACHLSKIEEQRNAFLFLPLFRSSDDIDGRTQNQDQIEIQSSTPETQTVSSERSAALGADVEREFLGKANAKRTTLFDRCASRFTNWKMSIFLWCCFPNILKLLRKFASIIKISTSRTNVSTHPRANRTARSREVMPSHFKVKEYCPLVFRAFREYWKLHDSRFRVSSTNDRSSDDLAPLGFADRTAPSDERNDEIEFASLPIARSLFRSEMHRERRRRTNSQYSSRIPSRSSLLLAHVDRRSRDEFQYIVETQGDTLLPHFYALFRLTVDDKENYVLVTRNVLSTKLKIHAKYDVKVRRRSPIVPLLLLLWFVFSRAQRSIAVRERKTSWTPVRRWKTMIFSKTDERSISASSKRKSSWKN